MKKVLKELFCSHQYTPFTRCVIDSWEVEATMVTYRRCSKCQRTERLVTKQARASAEPFWTVERNDT